MDDFEHPLPGHGRYRLLALSSQAHAEDITGYAIATLAGDRLQVEPTLAQARAWLEQRLRQDALTDPPQRRARR